jgi:hypothetical protein
MQVDAEQSGAHGSYFTGRQSVIRYRGSKTTFLFKNASSGRTRRSSRIDQHFCPDERLTSEIPFFVEKEFKTLFRDGGYFAS